MENELIKYNNIQMEIVSKNEEGGNQPPQLTVNIDKSLSIDKKITLKINEFYETYTIAQVKYLVSLSDEEFIQKFWDELELNQCGEKWDFAAYVKGCKDGLKAILMEVRKQGLERATYIKIKRHYTRKGMGRLYINGWGLQKCQNKLRKFLSGDSTRDIDMSKCHWNILVKLCETRDISCKNIKKFLKNPDEFLKINRIDKYELLKILYKDTFPTTEMWKDKKALHKLYKEKMAIFEELIDDEEVTKWNFKPRASTKDKKGTFNPMGSVMAQFLQMTEHDILSPILTKYQNYIEVPMFDGFQISRDADIDAVLLDICQSSGYEWIEKDNVYEIEGWAQEETNDYLTWVAEFEKKVFAINEPERRYAVDYENNPTLFTPASLCDRFVEEPNLKDWLKDENKKIYRKIDYYPYGLSESDPTGPDVYNMFQPYTRPLLDHLVTENDIQWFINLIKKSVVNYKNLEEVDNDPEITKACNWLLNALAFDIQHPGKNPAYFLVLYGSPGGGKDTLFKILGELKKRDRTLVTNKLDCVLGGQFNSSVEGVENIMINECATNEIREVSDALKDHVTANKITINEKYRKPYEIQNFCKIWFSTNNTFPLETEDRRCQQFQTANWQGSWRPKKFDFFDTIYKNMENEESMNKLWTFLNQRQIGNWIPCKNLYDTQVMKEAKEFSLPPSIRFSRFIIDNKLGQDYNDTDDTIRWSPCTFKHCYKEWVSEEYGERKDKWNVIKANLVATGGYCWGKSGSSRYIQVDIQKLTTFLQLNYPRED